MVLKRTEGSEKMSFQIGGANLHPLHRPLAAHLKPGLKDLFYKEFLVVPATTRFLSIFLCFVAEEEV